MQRILEKIGLTKSEVQLYLTALKTQPSTITDLSKLARVKRTTAYSSIERLKEFGLIKERKVNRQSVFQAENPENLIELAKNNEHKWHSYKKELENILPQLQPFLNQSTHLPKVSVYEGFKDIIKAKEDFFTTFKQYKIGYQIGDTQKIFNLIGSKFFSKKLTRRRRQIKDTKFYIMADSIPEEWQKTALFDEGFREVRLLKHAQKHHSTIVVCGNKVWVLKVNEQLLLVVIESKEVADLMRFICQTIWNDIKV